MELTASPTAVSAAAGISKGYASDIIHGKKSPSEGLALRIYRTTGLKLGRIESLSEAEIAVLEKVHG